MNESLPKSERQALLKDRIQEDPFLTDGRLAEELGVSIQTIRLDRLELGIPESRERTRRLAEDAYAKVRSIMGKEVIGELVDVALGRSGLSIMDTTPEMALVKTGIVRGHHIFAQANSLAVAIIDATVALTASARVRFKRPVRTGERLVAKARVMERVDNRYTVSVQGRVGEEEAFEGEFVVFAVNGEEGGPQ